ncbi:MAG: type II toxin-antitoxin system VapC family toxin [Treponema sp.]|nr:type II toxin-antitoxin system VapC family toxin [Treponema sp.]
MNYILDACALIAIFKHENGTDKIKALLDKADQGQCVIFMNIINLIEVHYGFLRTLGKDKAALILEKIYTLPIQFINTTDDVIFSETSRLKAQYTIPLGDSIGLATAIKMSGTFVTADHSDFEEIEKAENISFFWFR